MLKKILFGIAAVYAAVCFLVFVFLFLREDYLTAGVTMAGLGAVLIGVSILLLAFVDGEKKKR